MAWICHEVHWPGKNPPHQKEEEIDGKYQRMDINRLPPDRNVKGPPKMETETSVPARTTNDYGIGDAKPDRSVNVSALRSSLQMANLPVVATAVYTSLVVIGRSYRYVH